MDVERALDLADIHRDFEVVSGECISIANAIHAVFGGEFVAVSRRPNKRVIDHLTVRIDDTLYDGRGQVTEDQLLREFATTTSSAHIWNPTTTDTRPFRGPVFTIVRERLEKVVETGSYTPD